MCAQFTINCSASDLARYFELLHVSAESYDKRVLPRGKTPVVRRRGGDRILDEMQFSLVPSWSKERVVKFATHNARIETLTEKPTWKKPLQSRRALVPISSFIEPVYDGDFRGNMVSFRAAQDPVLAACAICDEWHSPEDGSVLASFAIVTGEPSDFVKTIGHDRQPLFLNREAWDEWLDPAPRKGEEMIALMRRAAIVPELSAEIDRPLKPGWEKKLDA